MRVGTRLGRFVLRLALGAAFVVFSAVPGRTAAAAKPESEIKPGGFLFGAPGIVSIPLDDGTNDALDVSFRWGAGGGYLFTFDSPFMLTIGGELQHVVWNWDEDLRGACSILGASCDFRGHTLRVLPVVRLGGGGGRVFGYGMLAPGLAVSFVEVQVPGGSADDSEAAFNMGLGGGVVIVVWRGLFVGAEVQVHITIYDDDGNTDYTVDNDSEALDLTAMIGWIF